MAHILIMDDEPALRAIMAEVLTEQGHEVMDSATGTVATNTALLDRLDLVITDLVMPDVEGMEVIRTVTNHRPDLPILAISGGKRAVTTDYLPLALHLGAAGFLRKPFDPDALINKVNAVLAGERMEP